MDSSEDPIIGLTLDGVITDWNPAAERLYGYSCEEVLGASIAMLVPIERQRRQLAEAQSVGGFGSWEWDMGADTIEWSDQLCRIYGLEPGRHP